MKVKVNRQLSQGQFRINFEVSDFSPEEVAKMGSFGVPLISIVHQRNNVPTRTNLPLNQIGKTFEAVFSEGASAKKYEDEVLAQIRKALEFLRESKDTFSSSEEVSI
jgi:hypothetical protein